MYDKNIVISKEIYQLWKRMYSLQTENNLRKTPFPNEIIELICIEINHFEKVNFENEYEFIDSRNDNNIEIKFTPNWDRDLTTINLNRNFDELHFGRLDKENNLLAFYKFKKRDLKKMIEYSSKIETKQKIFRYSLIKDCIIPNDIEPYVIENLGENI